MKVGNIQLYSIALDVYKRQGKSDNFWQNLTAESLVTFDKTFNKLHHLNVVAGFTYEKSDWGGKTVFRASCRIVRADRHL